MKTKIFNALKQAYASLGLSDEVLQSQADALASMGFVTDENLATVIQGQSTFLKTLQSGIDKRVTDAVAKAKEKDPKPAVPPEDPKPKEDVPSWAQAIIDQNKALTEELAGFKTQTAAQRRQSEVAAKAKEFGLPETIISRLAIPEDANLDEYFKGVKQDFVNMGFKETTPPDISGGAPKKDGDAIAEMINAGTKAIVESKK